MAFMHAGRIVSDAVDKIQATFKARRLRLDIQSCPNEIVERDFCSLLFMIVEGPLLFCRFNLHQVGATATRMIALINPSGPIWLRRTDDVKQDRKYDRNLEGV